MEILYQFQTLRIKQLQAADSIKDKQCQNRSEKSFLYRNRRCDLKIVLVWVYELNSCYRPVKKPCCLGILEGRRNYKHIFIVWGFFNAIKYKKETFQSSHYAMDFATFSHCRTTQKVKCDQHCVMAKVRQR